MNYIKITVREKRAKCSGRERIVCGNSDYVIKFDFDDEWAAYDTKTARFVCDGGKYTDVQFTGDEVGVPVLRDTRTVSVGCYAGDIHTTTAALIQAVPCCTDPDGTPADPAPDVYNQLMERFDKMEAPEAVLYTEQELTDEQKAAARANIGAMNAERFVVTIATDDSGNFSADKAFAEIRQAYENGNAVVAKLEQVGLAFAMRAISDSVVLFDACDSRAAGALVITESDDVMFDSTPIPRPSGDDPLPAGTATPGTTTAYARADHVHPSEMPTPTADGYVPTSFTRSSGDELVSGYTLHKPIRVYNCVKDARDKWMLVDLETGNKVAPSEIPDEHNVVICVNDTATTRTPLIDSSSSALEFDGTSGVQYDFETNTFRLRHVHVIVDRRYSTISVTTQPVLPVATPTLLGGVKPIAKTTDMTQDVGIDSEGKLYTKAGGGGADISLGVTATVGQTIKVKSVDDSGKPTAWEAADMASGGSGETWELINTSVVPAETTKLTITQDLAGKPFAYYELKYVIQVAVPSDKQDATIWFSCQPKTAKNASVKINGATTNQVIVGYASSLGGFAGGGNSLTIQPDVFSYGFADTVSISKLTMYQMYASSASLYLPEGTKVSLFGRGK